MDTSDPTLEGNNDDGDVIVAPRVQTKPKVETPKMWAVLFRNDDYTPLEYVVHVISSEFNLDLPMATSIALEVHQRGARRVGRFTRDVAETKAYKIVQDAKQNGHPLTVEPTEAD
jgi:ATP-dependent Clp protease adaptor protein ClpS